MFWMSCGVTFGGPSSDGIRSTSAPNACINCVRSSVKQSAITISARYPFARQTSARAGPVEPPVYSTTVSPDEISPSRSAPSIIESAIRSKRFRLHSAQYQAELKAVHERLEKLVAKMVPAATPAGAGHAALVLFEVRHASRGAVVHAIGELNGGHGFDAGVYGPHFFD